jgi:tetratricopeptide (TPR) repeat protein
MTSAPLEQQFTQAAALHEQGRWDEAEAAYRRILSAHPGQPDTLHMLGVLLIQAGRANEGFAQLHRALAARPDFVDAHFNCGAALLQQHRFAEALAHFDKVVALTPQNPDGHFNRGFAQSALGRNEAALASFDRALAGRPGDSEALVNRAIMLHRLNRHDDALAALTTLLAAHPDHVDGLVNFGIVLAAQNRAPEALTAFERALALQPQSPAALSALGVTLMNAGRFEEALDAFDRLLQIQPENAEAHFQRGGALKDMGRLTEALASYDTALAIRADYAEALVNRGGVLRKLGRPEEAIADSDNALTLRPRSMEALLNRGSALADLLRIDQALETYDRALAIDSDHALVRFNRSLILLLTERFEPGWAEYESRDAAFPVRRSFPQPAWRGEAPIAGKTLFVRHEQGLGDTIQFARYARLAADHGARVVLSVQAPLFALLRKFDARVEVISENETPASFDLHASLLSLPGAFGTTAGTIPLPVNLFADPENISAWATRLGQTSVRRIGIAWAGAPGHLNDRNRSIPLAALAPLFAGDAEWVSLQKEVRDSDRKALARAPVRSFSDQLSDFSETAALISNLDLVITVDTSVAHLAASLGKPTWIALPFAPDWRWMLNRSDTPWYPAARLFRQPAPGTWAPVIDQLHGALDAKIGNSHHPPM